MKDVDDRGDAARLLSGTEVIAELPLLMHARDAARGLVTGGYISGYRGSPLAQLDRVLARYADPYTRARIVAHTALNEDLAATAVWGTQQSGLFDGMRVDGIFGLWYGKGPGVDRSLDVLRHANAAGTDPKGGVLALMGDDHGAVSSTLRHQTEHDMVAAQIPVLAPAGLADFIPLGLAGWEMSRASGAWVGFKLPTEVVEARATVTLHPFLRDLAWPEGAGLLGLRAGDSPPVQEERMVQKLRMSQAFARLNRLDVDSGAPGDARIGIVASGKAWLDLVEALDLLGIDPAAQGIALRKVALTWPIEPEGMRDFAARCALLIVVEEKRPVLEDQIRALLYDLPDRPPLVGKIDHVGQTLFPALGELGPMSVAQALRRVLPQGVGRALPPAPEPLAPTAPGLRRDPYFCAGCPHATSTRLPPGSRATTGIGCHMMMIDAPGRATTTFTQMGGEGVSWLGLSPFSDQRHIFVNMGDGTYFHSGILAIRAAAAAGVNVTYKILFNDAVAMTGGQPHDGDLDVPALAAQLLAEGLTRVAVVAERPERLKGLLPAGVSLDPRDDLTRVQIELRALPGVTALIYDQVCAAEKRRRRKIGTYPQPAERVFINEAVCEGCGDCAVQSGCIALEPVETALGPKRRINQSACNVDLSCVKGFCPSFVILPGATLRRPTAATVPAEVAELPDPVPPVLGDAPFNLVLAGIGGSGVITVAGLLARAAEMQGLAVVGLDQTGLAQKNGAVISHLRLARGGAPAHTARVPAASADLILGFDMVVSASTRIAPLIDPARTRILCDDHLAPTAEIARSGARAPSAAAHLAQVAALVAPGGMIPSAGSRLALEKLGDALGANMIVLGHAWQAGLIPLERAAIEAAIGDGKGAAQNRAAFAWGRLLAAGRAQPARPAGDEPDDLDAVIARGAAHMRAWGGPRAARRWRTIVARARAAEGTMGESFTRAVAATGLRLLAYKDEYEVARLHRLPAFRQALAETFDTTAVPRFHLAPPLLTRHLDARTGRPAKIAIGRPAVWAFAVLTQLRALRGTPLDPFGHTAERRAERRLAAEYVALVDRLATELTPETHARCTRIAALGQMVRGFGPVKEAAIARYDSELAAALSAS
jgi:indolepyruvate ferredoxin oxidoreductase